MSTALLSENHTKELSDKVGASRGSEMLVPEDTHNIVWLIQFLYGFAMLLTFNVILSSLDFFQLKVRICSFSLAISEAHPRARP
mmetsp:Transcript_31692/g.37158  ORF Transcript_31692/g.37158 Transcript_31692/m.37158 type:complete len:84 (-) Transcript_31692:1433-1684(-)